MHIDFKFLYLILDHMISLTSWGSFMLISCRACLSFGHQQVALLEVFLEKLLKNILRRFMPVIMLDDMDILSSFP